MNIFFRVIKSRKKEREGKNDWKKYEANKTLRFQNLCKNLGETLIIYTEQKKPEILRVKK